MKSFNALYADQYDRMYAEKDYSGECDLVEAANRRHGNGEAVKLLDIGCGTGAHAINMARRGYQVTGIDLSQPMLDHASQKSAALPSAQRPNFLCGDVRTFDTKQQHDLAMMMFAVVGYLTSNDDVVAGLRNIRRHLRAGALFVSDFWYGPTVLSVRPTDRVRILPTQDGKVLRTARTTLDIANHCADVTFNLWELSKETLISETSETHRMRFFFPQEFALLLDLAGFQMLSISAFPSLDEPLSDTTWNAITVAKAV